MQHIEFVRHARLALCAAAVGVAVSFTAAAEANVIITPVVHTGMTSPGVSPSGTFTSLANGITVPRPLINNNGAVFFQGTTSSGTRQLLYTATPAGNLNLFAVRNDVAPDTGGLTWNTFQTHAGSLSSTDTTRNHLGTFNDSGHLMFRAALAGGASTLQGLFYYNGTSVVKVAQGGDPAPGTTLIYHTANSAAIFPEYVVNNSGVGLIEAQLNESGTTRNAIYHRAADGTMTLMARQNTAMPNIPPIPGFSAPTYSGTIREPKINNDGTFMFNAAVMSSGGSALMFGDASSDASSVRPAIYSRQPAPEIGANRWYFNPSHYSLNNNGHFAARVDIINNVQNVIADSSALMRGQLGATVTLAKVAEKGQSLGALADANWENFGVAAITETGDLAFKGRMSGPNVDTTTANGTHFGIFAHRNGSMEMIARMGEKVVDITGAPIVGDVNYHTLGEPSINQSGHVAFYSALRGADVSSATDHAIFAEIGGQLQMIVRKGQLVEVNGVATTITGFEPGLISASAPGSGRGTWFNDNDEIVFWASYTGGQGVFVVRIPEPSSLALLGLGFMGLMRGRTRR